MKTTWRLIKTQPEYGAWNMAVDEAILTAVQAKRVSPTLRLYAWEPPCLSLGYAQPYSDVNLKQLDHFGWDVVRRLTGGRAILHTDELTYAVIGPQDEPRFRGGVLESYRRLSQALIKTLRSLGLQVEALPLPPNQGAENNLKEPVCFEVPSNYEITIQGKKLVGSAQARKKDGVLQHGTIPLNGDITRITHVLKFNSEKDRALAAERMRARATTVEKVLNQSVSWEKAANLFSSAFEKTFNIQLENSDLTLWEQELADQLAKDKYETDRWNRRM
jgi:lipoate-protein ligase A